MKNTSKQLIKSPRAPQTTMLQLVNCTDKEVFKTIAKIEQSLSIRESVENYPLLNQLNENKTESIKQIIRIIEFFLKVTGKELESFQVIVLAGDLYERFEYDSLEDIILMFKMARKGEFGKVYHMDTFLISEWALQYLDKKSEEREKLYYDRKKKGEKKEKNDSVKFFNELSPEIQEQWNHRFKTQKPDYGIKIPEFLRTQKKKNELKKNNRK